MKDLPIKTAFPVKAEYVRVPITQSGRMYESTDFNKENLKTTDGKQIYGTFGKSVTLGGKTFENSTVQSLEQIEFESGSFYVPTGDVLVEIWASGYKDKNSDKLRGQVHVTVTANSWQKEEVALAKENDELRKKLADLETKPQGKVA